MMDKKKKAPARAKAFENYILSTKLFCGYCQAAMTGISGTSKTGTKYHYYQCVTNRRDKSCHKKTVSKAYIEDLVIKETRKLLTKENIDRIAKEVVRLCEQEKDTDNLKQLKRLLKENERATENLFKALESGQIVDVIAERISQKKRERNELEQQILVETSSHPTPTVNEVRFFLNQFRKGDVNDLKYRQALVDTFVNRIYLYDDKMTVLYNTQDSHSDVTIDDLSSSRVVLVEYPHQNPNSVPTRSRQVRLSASHVDSCRSRPVYHRTHTRRLQMYQSGVSENHGLLDRHDGTAQTMPSSVRGSALAFAVQQSGYSQGFLLFVLPAHQAAVWWTA